MSASRSSAGCSARLPGSGTAWLTVLLSCSPQRPVQLGTTGCTGSPRSLHTGRDGNCKYLTTHVSSCMRFLRLHVVLNRHVVLFCWTCPPIWSHNLRETSQRLVRFVCFVVVFVYLFGEILEFMTGSFKEYTTTTSRSSQICSSLGNILGLAKTLSPCTFSAFSSLFKLFRGN